MNWELTIQESVEKNFLIQDDKVLSKSVCYVGSENLFHDAVSALEKRLFEFVRSFVQQSTLMLRIEGTVGRTTN